MSEMNQIIEALGPIFSVVILGRAFGYLNFPGNPFWVLADKLTFNILLPVLLITKLSASELLKPGIFSMVGILVMSIIVLSIFLIFFQENIKLDSERFTSIFQGSIRPNIYVVLATSVAIFGREGLVLVAIVLAVVSPLVNFLSILVIIYYVRNKRGCGAEVFSTVIKNPIIIGCALGILLNVTGIGLPFGTNRLGEILGGAALPLGLLSVGAGLKIEIVRSWKLLIFSSGMKLLALPVLVAQMCWIFEVEGLNRMIAILVASVPCAVSSYIFATQLGGDEELMARIISFETLLALLTMPLLLNYFIN